MSIDDVANLSNQLAIIAGLILAIGAALKMMSSAIERGLVVYRNWKRRRSIRGLLITPTAEEMARYSLKLPQKIDLEEVKQGRRYKQFMDHYREQLLLKMEGRMFTILFFFICLSLFIAGRMSYLSLLQ